MIVLVLQRVPVSLRGFLTRWLLEIEPGVFVGHLSAQVGDAIWREVEMALQAASGAIMVCSAQNAQRITFRVSGHPNRTVVDMEGISLIRRKAPPPPL
jgi:CRISPR-associated protein Cas2